MSATMNKIIIPCWRCNWRCNGSINPLIRSVEQLRAVSGEEFREAARWCATSLQQDTQDWSRRSSSELEAVVQKFFERRVEPRWQRAREILPRVRSAAQFLAKHGNTDCRAQCEDLADLLTCFALVGSYNFFDATIGAAAFHRFNRAQFFSENNPNTGRDAFTYSFGWEGSHAVYIRLILTFGVKVLSPDWRHWQHYTAEDFKRDCQRLARESSADESGLFESDETVQTWRLWWD
jgi:hypothetical protein